MKLLFLCKRRYMSHDVIHDRYGRLYQLPNELSLLGHDVAVICLSYQNAPPETQTHRNHSAEEGLLSWQSFPAGRLGWRIPFWLHQTAAAIASFAPDAIVGGSDALHVLFTRWLAHKAGVPYCIDLYDNFESFGLSSFPGLIRGYRRSLQQARAVTTVSRALCGHIQHLCPDVPVYPLESTISPEQFKPCPKEQSRELLGLDKGAILIGTAGSLSASRDTCTLYEAFLDLHSRMPNAYLILAGPIHENPPPDHSHILYLGQLPHEQIAHLLSALDLAVICMGNNSFGRYAFPQKAYEILACQTPVISAKVGALQELFADYPDCLYQPGNVAELSAKMERLVKEPLQTALPIPTWHDQAVRLAGIIARHIP